MKPQEIICTHCNRNATQTQFSHPGICASCMRTIRLGGKPRANKKTINYTDHTCACGEYKASTATRCRGCRIVDEYAADPRNAATLTYQREALRAFLKTIGFTGDTVPTS